MSISNSQIIDTIPVTAALQRLLKANVQSDDQLYDYNLAQSLRSVFWAVKNTNKLPLYGKEEYTKKREGNDSIDSSYHAEHMPFSTSEHSHNKNTSTSHDALYVITELCRFASVSLEYAHTCVYLSLRLLCDEDSMYGQGNERPCVREEWIDALIFFVESNSSAWHVDRRVQLGYMIVISAMLHGIALCGVGNSGNSDAHHNSLSELTNSNDINSLKMMRSHCDENMKRSITASSRHRALFVHFTKLVHGLVHVVMPVISVLASSQPLESAYIASNINSTENNTDIIRMNIALTPFRPPSRLIVEANNCIIHSFHAFCVDILQVHDMERNANSSNNAKQFSKVIDRESPLELWSCFTLVRNALKREIEWIISELKHHCELHYNRKWNINHVQEHEAVVVVAAHESKRLTQQQQQQQCEEVRDAKEYNEHLQQTNNNKNNNNNNNLTEGKRKNMYRWLHNAINQVTNPLTEMCTILERVLSSMLQRQEQFNTMRAEVKRQYGESATDYHTLSEIMFTHTLQMCVCMRELTEAWLRVNDGLLLQHFHYFHNYFNVTCESIVDVHRYNNTDEKILALLAQCLMQLPEVNHQSNASPLSSSSLPLSTPITNTIDNDNNNIVEREEITVFTATTLLLSACLTFFVQAPLRSIQARIWHSNLDVTREIHGLLVQRGLRHRDSSVLQLVSLLCDSIMMSSTWNTSSSSSLLLLESDETMTASEMEEEEEEEHQYYCNLENSTFASQLVSTSSEQLLDLIATERDGASETAKKLLAHAILCQPHVIIPSLFRLLTHGSTIARLNVLDVLHALPELTCASYDSASCPLPTVINSSNNNNNNEKCEFKSVDKQWQVVKQSNKRRNATRKKTREMLRLLAQHLLFHIHDEELCVRMQSSQLFSRVAPEDMMEPLLHLCMQTDSTGRKQSVSLASLRTVMAAHTSNSNIIILLLQITFALSQRNQERVKQTINVPINNDSHSNDSKTCSTNKEETNGMKNENNCTLLEKKFNKYNVPSTPGEVLPLSFLYCHEEENNNDDESNNNHNSSSNKYLEFDRANVILTSETKSATMSTHVPKKLHHLVTSLIEYWVKSVKSLIKMVPTDNTSSLIVPLFTFLLEQANNTHECEVQWYVKYITHLLSFITTFAMSESCHWNAQEVYNGIIFDMYKVFFSDNMEKHNKDDNNKELASICNNKYNCVKENNTMSGVWGNALAQVLEQTSSTVEEQLLEEQQLQRQQQQQNVSLLSSECVYQLLLPLLCLRACHREMYKTAWREETSRTCSPLHVICEKLWCGLVLTYNCALFRQHAELQRVLLEVLTRFPSCVFFDQLTRVRKNTLSTNSLHLFLDRVYTFGICTYLNLELTTSNAINASTNDSNTNTNNSYANKEGESFNMIDDKKEEKLQSEEHVFDQDDSKVVMAQVPTLLELIHERILPWLASDISNGNDNVELQKLSSACADALVLITFAKWHNKLEVITTDTATTATVKHESIDELNVTPFTLLANAFRSDKPLHLLNAFPSSFSSSSLLLLFEFSMHVQRRLLAMLRTQRFHKQLLQQWWRVYLPLFTELANASCSWLSKKNCSSSSSTVSSESNNANQALLASSLHVAEGCCEVLFTATMVSAKMCVNDNNKSSNTASSSPLSLATLHSTSSNNLVNSNVNVSSEQSILTTLGLDDQQALIEFALGTARYSKLPSVQSVGVKLLSALLAAAPELFLAFSENHKVSDERTVNTKNTSNNNNNTTVLFEQFKHWQDAIHALALVAHIHPDHATRVLAERVLTALTSEK